MAVKEDIRITKTKEALSKAFFEMLIEMPLENISINDLCVRADVRRATFYKHFRDKSDFVFSVIATTRERFDQRSRAINSAPMSIKEYYLNCARSVANYLLRYEQSIKSAFKSEARPTFIEMFVRQNYEDTVKRFERSIADGIRYFASADMMASMLIGGVAHTVVIWFESDEKCSVDKLLEDISIFLDRLLR